MSDKDLKDKAIKVQGGKEYVLVSDRVIFFNENFPNGMIETQLLTPADAEYFIIRATVVPDVDKPTRYFTGFSRAVKGEGVVNKTAALENAETSAIGRALGMMGIGVIDSIASADEMAKAGAVHQHADSINAETGEYNESPTATTGASENAEICEEHGVKMFRAVSKKNNKPYWYHKDENGMCFGHGYQ